MDIGIIGSGHIGGILARHLAALGHQVRIANSRGPESLAVLAASAPDVVIVTIPQKALPELPRGLFAGSTAAVVDTGNYYPTRDGRIDPIDEGLTDSEWVLRARSGGKLVGGCSTDHPAPRRLLLLVGAP